jgi:hypothetical protein
MDVQAQPGEDYEHTRSMEIDNEENESTASGCRLMEGLVRDSGEGWKLLHIGNN